MKRRDFLLAVGGLALAPAPSEAAPAAELWPRWQAHDPGSTATVDHGAWARLLERYLKAGPVNLMAYDAVTRDDRDDLEAYIAGLGRTEVSALNRDEQFAFWVNLYNALTVQVILAHYPVESIRDIDISPGLFADGPWGAELVEVEGTALSLDDIEHRILRPIWADPRIHYAVNCASIGCPNLQPLPYTAANREELLERGARQYVNHPRGARIDDGELRVSSIYLWYEVDFGGDDAGVIQHLKSHAGEDLAAGLTGVGEISGHQYNWDLNGA
jgi:hypothetical protein